MDNQNIQTFFLKAGDSVNNQPNDNIINSKLKFHYNEVKYEWILNYGMKRFLPYHMNSILMESWDGFKVSFGNVIRKILEKITPPPLILPDLTTNTQSCDASLQVSYRYKAEEVNDISRLSVAYIEVQEIMTNDTRVVLQAKGSQQ